MLHPGERLGVLGETHEVRAFQRQNIVFLEGDGHIAVRTTREHFGQGFGDGDIVRRGFACARRPIDGHIERQFGTRAGQAEFELFRHLIAFGERQNLGFSVRQQPVAVHRNTVIGAQVHQFLSEMRGFGDLGRAEGLEDFTDGGHRAARATLNAEPALQHLLAPAPTGDNADADFHQAHIGFGMGLDRIAMQQDFTPSPQGHARGRADDGEGGVFERLIGLLPGFHDLFNRGPEGDIGSEEGKPQVRPHREVRALVINHEALVALGRNGLHGFYQQGHNLIVEAVHLRGELEAQHAVANIPNRGRGVFQYRLRVPLDVGQQQHAGAAFDRMIGTIGAEEL